MSTSYAFAELVINAAARGIPFSFGPTLYLGAFNSAPGTDGDPVTHEVAGAGYGRVVVAFPAPSSGSSILTNVAFPMALGSWGSVAGLGLCDTETGGQVLLYESSTSTPISTNQILSIATLTLSFP